MARRPRRAGDWSGRNGQIRGAHGVGFTLGLLILVGVQGVETAGA